MKVVLVIVIVFFSQYNQLFCQCSNWGEFSVELGRDRLDYFDNKDDSYSFTYTPYFCNNKSDNCINVIKFCIEYTNNVILSKVKYELIVKEATGKTLLKQNFTYNRPKDKVYIKAIPIELFLDKQIKSKYSFRQYPPKFEFRIIETVLDKKETAAYIIRKILDDYRYQEPSKLKHFYSKAKEYDPKASSVQIETMIKNDQAESKVLSDSFNDFIKEFVNALKAMSVDEFFNNFIAETFSHPDDPISRVKGNQENAKHFDSFFSETLKLFENSKNYEYQMITYQKPSPGIELIFDVNGTKHIYRFLKTDLESNKDYIRNNKQAFNLSSYSVLVPEEYNESKKYNLSTIQSYIEYLKTSLEKGDKSFIADILTRYPIPYSTKKFIKYDRISINKRDDLILERSGFIKNFDYIIFKDEVTKSILNNPKYSIVDQSKMNDFSFQHLKTIYGGEVQGIYTIEFKESNFIVIKMNNEYKLSYIEIK